MTSAPHLLTEDRHEYERLLDEALRTAHERPELASMGERLNEAQLRTMALNATALLTAAAAGEYDHFVKVREERRGMAFPLTPSRPVYSSSRPASAPAPARRAPAGRARRFGAAVLAAGAPGARGTGDAVAPSRWAAMSYGRRLLAALLGLHVRPPAPAPAPAPARSAAPSAAGARWSPRTSEWPVAARTRRVRRETAAPDATEAAGAGVVAVFAVLAPVLSGAAAALLFLIGLVFKTFSADSGAGRAMFAAGWVCGAVAMAAIVFCVVGLLVTAVRNGSTEMVAVETDAVPDELERAREAWHNALLERGIMPFLRDALADPSAEPSYPTPRTPGAGRIPNLGYTRPDFTSPGAPAQGPRPGYSSPDFTSPDFGGPDHQSE